MTAITGRTHVDAETERAITRFLFDEAELIDDMRFTEWLECMHQDVFYWAPVRENRVFRERDEEFYPRGTSAYFEETWDFLKQRVDRLLTAKAWAEEPASRSRHIISNVRVDAREDGRFAVKSNFFIYRTRGERDQDEISGERRDVIVAVPDSPWGFQVLEREVRFDMATILVKNLSLFY